MTNTPESVCLLLAEEVWGSPLHAMRSLANRGVPVYVAVAGRGAQVFGRSRYATAACDIEPGNAQRFCTEASGWVDTREPGQHPVIVIPLSDRLLAYLNDERAQFPERFRLAIPSSPTAAALLNKAESLKIAEGAGLHVPVWRLVASAQDITGLGELRLPIAIRPTSWDAAGNEHFKLEVHRDRAELADVVRRRLFDGARLIAQEYVEAPENAVEFGILWRSRDRMATTICTGRKHRLAEPNGGVMAWGQTVDLPDLRQAAEDFLDESGFTGLGGIEFIRRDGRLHFIEFNPRLEAIHFLGGRAGVDTVRLAFDDVLELPPPAPLPTQRSATAWVGSAWLHRLRTDPSSLFALVRDRWRFAQSPRPIRAIWRWSDPWPGVAVTIRIIRRACSSVIRSGRRRERSQG